MPRTQGMYVAARARLEYQSYNDTPTHSEPILIILS
jgi:hypothetical protein